MVADMWIPRTLLSDALTSASAVIMVATARVSALLLCGCRLRLSSKSANFCCSDVYIIKSGAWGILGTFSAARGCAKLSCVWAVTRHCGSMVPVAIKTRSSSGLGAAVCGFAGDRKVLNALMGLSGEEGTIGLEG